MQVWPHACLSLPLLLPPVACFLLLLALPEEGFRLQICKPAGDHHAAGLNRREPPAGRRRRQAASRPPARRRSSPVLL